MQEWMDGVIWMEYRTKYRMDSMGELFSFLFFSLWRGWFDFDIKMGGARIV